MGVFIGLDVSLAKTAVRVVDDPGRFGTSKAPGAHLGLMPRVYQSAEIAWTTGTSDPHYGAAHP